MPVTIKVNGAANSLVHKGSNHVSTATIPDVCKTPTPGGPVPIPYPNISQSATLAKGTTTVKADGGMMIAIKGSEFSLSNGDEPGSIGGVKSSTFIKESTWILYSFDVKIEGKGACRLGDKKFQNHENTADLMGAVGPPVLISPAQELLQEIMCNCHQNTPKPPGGCKEHGIAKHQCCEDAIQKHKGSPEIGGERGYLSNGSAAAPRASYRPAPPKGSSFPDACSMSGGNPTQFFDFKFPCGGEADANFYFPVGRSQFDKYKKLGKKLKPPVTTDPVPLTSRSC